MGLFDWIKSKLAGDTSKHGEKSESCEETAVEYRPIVQKSSDIKQEDLIKQEEMYIPDVPENVPVQVEHIELTYAQAHEQGWHFKIKSRKRIRITRYTGTEKNIVIPSKIGEYTVNELRKSLFFRAQIDSIKIPDTVKKIGDRCLSQSTVREIIFDEGVLAIPKEFAFSCQLLEHVHLPNTLCRIENCAFENCKKLKYLTIPRNCSYIGHYVFARSSLEGFAYLYRKFAKISGDSFESTPIEKKHKLILCSEPNKDIGYHILLVCRNAHNVKLPEGKARLENHSLLSGYRNIDTLDFSRCSEIHTDLEAFQLNYNYNGMVYNTINCRIIVPQGTTGSYFPGSVNVTYPNGRKYDGFCLTVSRSEDSITLRKNTEFLPAYSICCKEKEVIIHTHKWTYFEQHAVCSRDIEHISFSYLHRGEGELFAPCCESLHHVEWNETAAFIPSSKLIGKPIHEKLLKAFVGRNIGGIVYVFDGSMIDRVFFDYDSTPGISQKKRILIAVDVLRSTSSLFKNRESYNRYLQTHKRYALILCKSLPQEYADFLKKFYETGE